MFSNPNHSLHPMKHFALYLHALRLITHKTYGTWLKYGSTATHSRGSITSFLLIWSANESPSMIEGWLTNQLKWSLAQQLTYTRESINLLTYTRESIHLLTYTRESMDLNDLDLNPIHWFLSIVVQRYLAAGGLGVCNHLLFSSKEEII